MRIHSSLLRYVSPRVTIAFCFISSLGFGLSTARANLEVGAAVSIRTTVDFDAPLGAHGSWVEVRGQGRCWHPASVAVGWRPYCDGYWAWTDCGWYWISDEPWAWACYHYGYWMVDPGFGWVWVPALDWGPSWVSWRVGGEYIGWAPLPPPHVTLVAGPEFVFVSTSRFHERIRPATVIVNNPTILGHTTVVNNIRHETKPIAGGTPQQLVFNEGPGLATMQKATANRVKLLAIKDAVHQTPAPRLGAAGQPHARPEESPPTKNESPQAAGQQGLVDPGKPAVIPLPPAQSPSPGQPPQPQQPGPAPVPRKHAPKIKPPTPERLPPPPSAPKDKPPEPEPSPKPEKP